jgi:hypothetical protein
MHDRARSIAGAGRPSGHRSAGMDSPVARLVARSHFGPIRAQGRLWPSAREGKRPGQRGCAARDLNPQPAD